MPAVTTKRRAGLKPRTPREGVPEPGIGGYDYPRGPYGATGFPGSTPASPRTHTESRPEGGRGLRQLDAEANQDEWASLPTRRRNGTPRQPFARQMRSTSAEHRMVPVSEHAPGSQNVRNEYAQRFRAVPGQVHAYRPSPNPGKTGAHLTGPSQHHPSTVVHGEPDGAPVPGMPSQPGPPYVLVPSRYVSREGGQEGYAVNRPETFAKGSVAGFPSGYKGDEHLRGGRLTGQRYFGAIADQQRIGLDSDAYGISRRRGPRHRPVRFQTPEPWTANYYDVAPEQGKTAPDMIHRSPSRPRLKGRPRRG